MTDFNAWLNHPIPDDATLGEFRQWILNWDGARSVGDAVRRSRGWSSVRIEIRFVSIPERNEYADHVTVRLFRMWSNAGKANIEISIGDGGQKVREPDLVLT